MRIVGWKAWYTQNRVYSSYRDSWEDLPKVGCLYVVLFLNSFAGDVRHREILSGNRRYFMAVGSSGEKFIKPSLWKENKLLETYDTKPEWIKEGIWDDDTTMAHIQQEALDTHDWR